MHTRPSHRQTILCDMAIEAHLYPNNAAFPFRGSKNSMIDNIQSCLNSQLHSHKHHPQQGDRARQINPNPNMSLADLSFSSFSNSNVQNQNVFNDPQSLATQFHQQTEIDSCIRSQNEKLRILLQEQRKQQLGELLKKVELNALYMLRQKDEEIEQAIKKTTELNEFLRRLEVENQSWRKVAEENEATVLSLHNSLEQMKERAQWVAKSCCDDNIRNTAMEEGTGENRVCRGGVGEVEQIRKRTMDCKCCHSQKSCFMFLPCRHLCSCKTCEPFLQVCPVCDMPKKSSIETLIV